MALINILAIGAGSLVVAAGLTFLAPRNVHVERSAVLDATPAQILALAASNEGYQQFNPYKATDPDLKIAFFGPSSGVGSGFSFEGKEGKGTQTVAQISESSVTYAIDLGPMGTPTQRLHVEPTDSGTRVTWSMDADMGLNPIARVIGLFMDGMMGKTFDTGLERLSNAAA